MNLSLLVIRNEINVNLNNKGFIKLMKLRELGIVSIGRDVGLWRRLCFVGGRMDWYYNYEELYGIIYVNYICAYM